MKKPTGSSLPKGIKTKKGTLLTFEQIHKIFSKTNYGYILKHRMRWGMFKPAEYSDKEWEKALGPDANNLDHLLVAFRQTKNFLHKENTFNEKDKEILLLTSIVHDWAEPAVGDILRDVKTKVDDKRELVLLKSVLQEVLGSYLYPSTIREICTILWNKENRLGKAFNTIETLGYFETAFRAWEQSKKVNGDLKMKLKWLTSNVLIIDISRLIERERKYTSVHQFLKKYRNIIQESFLKMPESVFEFHRHDKRASYQETFKTEKNKWMRYIESLSK